MQQQLLQRSSSVSSLLPEMCSALSLMAQPHMVGTRVSHQVEPVKVAAGSLPSVDGFVARNEASAPAKPSPVAHRESRYDEPMDIETSV